MWVKIITSVILYHEIFLLLNNARNLLWINCHFCFQNFLCRMLWPWSVQVTIFMCMHVCLFNSWSIFSVVCTLITRGTGERWTHIPPNQCWPSCKWTLVLVSLSYYFIMLSFYRWLLQYYMASTLQHFIKTIVDVYLNAYWAFAFLFTFLPHGTCAIPFPSGFLFFLLHSCVRLGMFDVSLSNFLF